MEALRIYIRELRKARGITQEGLADAMGLSLRGLTRWEAGQTDEIKSGPLFKAIDYLKAPMTHVQQLISNTAMSIDEVQALVRDWLREEQIVVSQFAASIPDDQVSEALDLIRELKDDPLALNRLLGYAHGLVEKKRAS